MISFGITVDGIANKEPIEIVSIMCGWHYMTQIGPMLSSMIRNSNASLSRIHFTLIIDHYGREYMEICLPALRSSNLSIDLVNYTSFKSSPRMQTVETVNPRWKCALNKLALSEMLPNLTKIMVLDLDIIIQEDLALLWDHFYDPSTEKKLIHATWESHDDVDVKLPVWPRTGFNSGVMLMNLQNMRERNITSEMFLEGLAPESKLLAGDQAFFNQWFANHTSDINIFPCKWNKRIENHCPALFNRTLRHRSGIAHGPNNAFKKHWDLPYPYSDFDKVYCSRGTA